MSQLLKAHNQGKKGTKREAVGRKEGVEREEERIGGRETEIGGAERRGRERENAVEYASGTLP